MSTARRNLIRFVVSLACFLAFMLLWLAIAEGHPDPAFLRKFRAKMVLESRMFDLMERDYEVNGDREEILREMKSELVAKGWKYEEGWISETDTSGGRSSGSAHFFAKGAEQIAFQPTTRDKHRIVLVREMSWLERQWHEALIRVGLRNRYHSVR